jgi:hypothetical protein
MTRLPGCALQVRGRVTGFFDRTSLSCRKTGRIHAPTLRAFLHPPAASYGDPGGKSHITSRTTPGVAGQIFCRSAPCARTPPQGGLLGRVRAQGALLQGVTQVWGWRINLAGRLFVEAHPVRDKPTERYTAAWLSRTGCAPTDKPSARRDTSARCAAKAEAQRGSALSPQRFGRVAQRMKYPLCTLGGCPTTTHLKRSGLSQHDAAGVLGHSLWVTFLLGQQEKSDSSGGSRSKRPPRRRHAGGQRNNQAPRL